MPLGLLIIGAILSVSALRGTERDLGTLLASDFTGAGNFGYWIAALAIIGGLGYVPAIAGPSRALLALILLAFFLANGQGFFSQLNSALAQGQATQSEGVTPEKPIPAPPHVVLEGGSAGSKALGGILGAVGKAVTGGLTDVVGGLAGGATQ